MSTAVQSIGNIDIDLITLPLSDPTENDVNGDCEQQLEEKANQGTTIQKWDWNADFIPLQFDGTVTILPPHTENCNESHSDASQDSSPSKSPLKSTTQIYRDNNMRIPPWISNSYSNHNFIDRLHMELVDFCMFISPTQKEHSIRLNLIERIKHIVLSLWPLSTIHVFGSMKTKLYLPTSDIDLAVYPNNSNGDYKVELAAALRGANMCSYLEIISTARVPLVKFTDASSDISVDIVFDRSSGVIAASKMNSLQCKYPVLRPLTYFLKYFLWFRDLNEPFRGGMGSYLLQMLIVNLIQSHPIRATRRWRHVDSEISLGGWLMAFFELYGKNFNYSELGISPYPNAHYFIKQEHGMKVYDRPHLLCCQCPFESTSSNIMDSGRNTYNIMKIKLAFEWADNTLLAHNINGDNASKSILGLLVGIRGETLQNRKLKFQMNVFDSDSNCESESESFIPLNDTLSSCTSSDSSYATYNNNGDIESDEGCYYFATQFQQKHLFNTNEIDKDIIFSFEKELIEDNPYLNEKYNPFPKRNNKRRLFDNKFKPLIKKRKTKSIDDLDDKNKSDLRGTTPCIFYQKGGCKKGELCPFQHGDDDKSTGVDDNDTLADGNQVCWNFASGHCHRGSKCRWLHSLQPTLNT